MTLRPGERIEFPEALVGFYQGDIHAGRNALCRFIRDWYPRWQGQDLDAPVYWNHAFTFEARINDKIFRRQMPVCAELGFEWMQIDWGWYAGCIPPMGMTHGIGNWTTVEPTRFPNSIEPLAGLVRSYGMKYCTWVDPEQAHPSSTTARTPGMDAVYSNEDHGIGRLWAEGCAGPLHSLREVTTGPGQDKAGTCDVVGRNLMADVHDRQVWRQPQEDPLHDSHIGIRKTEIRCQCHNRRHMPLPFFETKPPTLSY